MSRVVLIVEDERGIRDLVRRYLEREGLRVLTTGSGAEAITMAADTRPDLVVLDLGLPDVPGEEVTRELVLRVHAVLRRGDRTTPATPGPVSFGDGELHIDDDRREAVVRGTTVDLTPTEWDLLGALARTAGRVFSRYELINEVRGYEFEGYERTIDSHVKNLRRKIEADPQRPRIILTVLGAGYRLGLTRDG